MGDKPVWKTRAGGVTAAIFENNANVNGRSVSVLKVNLQRRFRDKDGAWKSSNSFGRNEILLAVLCLNRAFEKIIEAQNGSQDSPSNTNDDMVM